MWEGKQINPQGEAVSIALQFISAAEARARTCVCRTKQWKLVKDGLYPKPVPLGSKKLVFVEAEISEWIAAKVAARDGAAT